MYPFRYTTINEARQYSGTVDDDEKVLQKIELWSHIINDYTGKVFVPMYYDGKLEQLFDDRFIMTGFVSILEMSSPVEVTYGYRDIVDVPYVTDLLSSDDPTTISTGSSLLYRYVDVVGHFGNIQRNRAKVTTAVSGAVAVGGKNIILDSISNINAGDILLIDNYITAIVVECCGNNTVAVDPIALGIEDGSEVVVYGSMLPDILYCVSELISKKGFGITEQRNLRFQEKLVQEQTDSYMYRLAGNSPDYGYGADGTGILEVDRILERYKEQVDLRLI